MTSGTSSVRDAQTGELTLVSIGVGGVPANGDSNGASISADGTKVAFSSRATNLVSGDANADTSDVFVRDLATGTTTLVDRTVAGDQPPSASQFALISADGRRVAFSTVDPLDPVADTNASRDIYVRDLVAASTQLVSRANGAGGAVANDHVHVLEPRHRCRRLTGGVPHGRNQPRRRRQRHDHGRPRARHRRGHDGMGVAARFGDRGGRRRRACR